MLISLVDVRIFDTNLPLVRLGIATLLIVYSTPRFVRLLPIIKGYLFSQKILELYQKISEPEKNLFGLIVLLSIGDLVLLAIGKLIGQQGLIEQLIEILLSLVIAVTISWLGFQVIERIIKFYAREKVAREAQISYELLVAAKRTTYFLLVLIVIIVFCETHQINIWAVVASLGLTGIAIAFAAKNTLEQLIDGIVIYLDKPFRINSYIGLPDGTFGRVESIGLRSTKIRNSGKGTLMVIPNSYLSQVNIENFTGANKLIYLRPLKFFGLVTEDKKALIRELIAQSFKNVEGIESVNSKIIFPDDPENNLQITVARVEHIITYGGIISAEMVFSLLSVIKENIRQKLLEHHINFDISEAIKIDSPISI